LDNSGFESRRSSLIITPLLILLFWFSSIAFIFAFFLLLWGTNYNGACCKPVSFASYHLSNKLVHSRNFGVKCNSNFISASSVAGSRQVLDMKQMISDSERVIIEQIIDYLQQQWYVCIKAKLIRGNSCKSANLKAVQIRHK
jgi:hypothetical protein